ncbi:MAG: bifunctional nicotinamidase/pyrazinamidase [Spiribacter sp.]|jgi:nicotinamidase/pyrazinamidase|nr:bifunctional nicotinamidase/pyrazinamidase [Spiribacter sp.]
MVEMSPRAALLVVDMQPDFMEGGALATDAGSSILSAVARLMSSDRYADIAATQDWHPAGHVSFASRHGAKPFNAINLYGHQQMLWPDHCVQGTAAAELHPDLPWARASVIIRKGEDPQVDSYSGLLNNWNPDGRRPPTGLAGWLRERGITQVDCCGLARDFCVKWTAEDAAAAGFDTRFIWPLTRPVDASNDETVRADLTAAGVRILEEHPED